MISSKRPEKTSSSRSMMDLPPTCLKALFSPPNRVLNPPDNITPVQEFVMIYCTYGFVANQLDHLFTPPPGLVRLSPPRARGGGQAPPSPSRGRRQTSLPWRPPAPWRGGIDLPATLSLARRARGGQKPFAVNGRKESFLNG